MSSNTILRSPATPARELDAGKSWVDSAESFGEMEDRAALWPSKNVPQKSDLPARYGIEAPAHKADPIEVGPRRKTVAVWDRKDAGAVASDVPMCPLCGAPMVERVARLNKTRWLF